MRTTKCGKKGLNFPNSTFKFKAWWLSTVVVATTI